MPKIYRYFKGRITCRFGALMPLFQLSSVFNRHCLTKRYNSSKRENEARVLADDADHGPLNLR